MHLIQRLEQALRLWEDMAFLWWVGNKAEPQMFTPCGAMKNWQEFRDFLLTLQPMKQTVIDDHFAFSPEGDAQLGSITGTPYDLTSWTIQSRRVYHIPEGLSVLLTATKLDGLTWKDVRLPFESFCVSLDVPIINDKGTRFDFIIVSRTYGQDGKAYMVLHLLSDHLKDRKPVSWSLRDALKKDVRNLRPENPGRYQRLLEKIANFHESGGQVEYSTRTMFFAPSGSDLPVTLPVDALYQVTAEMANRPFREMEKEHPEWDAAMRIVIGISLYLKSLPSKYRPGEIHSPISVIAGEIAGGITKGTEVCSVAVAYEIHPEISSAIREDRHLSTKAICARFVEGYYRRPAGRGSDPDAERTEWVKPHLWGGKKLRTGNLPGGTEKYLA